MTHLSKTSLATIFVTSAALLGLPGCLTDSEPGQPEEVAGSEQELVEITSNSTCVTLFAGQTIDAGSVCASIDNTTDTSAACGVGSTGSMIVTYTTTGGWELTEAHLAVGDQLGDIPMTKAGNPKIGNFPYNSGNITGATSHSFSVPLCTFGLDGSDTVCDPVNAFMAAHAAVRLPKGDGTYQTETGWGDGDRFVQKGSWAEYFNLMLECTDDPEPPPPPPLECDTAWAFAEYTFDCSVPNNGDPANYHCGPAGDIGENWGWYGSFDPAVGFSSTLYAGAGQNNTLKGVAAGSASVSCSGADCDIHVQTSGAWKLEDFQAYIGCEPPDTMAPGQLGNNWSDYVSYDSGDTSYTGTVSGLPACASGSYFVAIHTSVCQPAS